MEADHESLPHHEKRTTQLKLPISFSEVNAALRISSINISLLSLQRTAQVLFEFHKTRAVAAPQRLRNFSSWQGLAVPPPPRTYLFKSHTPIRAYIYIYVDMNIYASVVYGYAHNMHV